MTAADDVERELRERYEDRSMAKFEWGIFLRAADHIAAQKKRIEDLEKMVEHWQGRLMEL